MEPLSKQDIDELEVLIGDFFHSARWQRLFYTARLGAEFVAQTAQKGTPS